MCYGAVSISVILQGALVRPPWAIYPRNGGIIDREPETLAEEYAGDRLYVIHENDPFPICHIPDVRGYYFLNKFDKCKDIKF